MISPGTPIPDDDPRDITLRVREYQWQLTREEFSYLGEELAPLREVDCDDIERALAEFNGGDSE